MFAALEKLKELKESSPKNSTGGGSSGARPDLITVGKEQVIKGRQDLPNQPIGFNFQA